MSAVPIVEAVVVPETRQCIVAEITVNWPQDPPLLLISQRFESVIAVNDLRGYDLVSHSHSQVLDAAKGHLVETIVAVFRRRGA